LRRNPRATGSGFGDTFMNPSTHASLARLEDIAGGENVATADAEVRAREASGVTPSVVVRPADVDQIAEILRFAAAEKMAVIPTGGSTKLGIGSAPARYDIALDLSRMNRVLAYDPHDLTLGVEPGVRIEELLLTLAQQRQFLPLAVPFLDRATIGGIVATNSSSPLRHAYGAARDFCLGMEFVTGDGARTKSGGRVVKNVTGYDLHKLLIGSLGTLAVITRVNFRTFPLPSAQGAFVATFRTAREASDFCLKISHSVLTPQIVEIADPGSMPFLFSGEASERAAIRLWLVIVSVAGPIAVVDRHARELRTMAEAANAQEFKALDDTESTPLLTHICEYPRLILEAAPSALIFRVGLLPGAIPSTLQHFAELADRGSFDLATLTRASGILYAAFLPGKGTESSVTPCVRLIQDVLQVNAIPEARAQAFLEWCPSEIKRIAGDPWGQPRADFPLMRKVKSAFDPRHVLSPGRFAGGI
jgi:glycolate oxidase FAD binding subunit